MYRILGAPWPGCLPDYRGAHRDEPGFMELIPEEAQVNRLWRWYADAWNEAEDGYVHELKTAFQMVAEYKTYHQQFDVVRFSFQDDTPDLGERFLGVDVVDKTTVGLVSLLCSGLRTFSDEFLTSELSGYRSRLNSNVLFENWTDGQRYARTVTKLQTEKRYFDPVAVYVPIALFKVEQP